MRSVRPGPAISESASRAKWQAQSPGSGGESALSDQRHGMNPVGVEGRSGCPGSPEQVVGIEVVSAAQQSMEKHGQFAGDGGDDLAPRPTTAATA